MTDPKTTGRGPPMWLVAVLVAGGAFYLLIAFFVDEKGTTVWGVRGDAVAPFAALLNAGALIALLRSVGLQREALAVQQRELRLQRKELRLQRQEFRDSREVMKEQKEQFERTAKAQEDLAASQARLAEAQEDANRLAIGAEVSQRHATIVSLEASIASLNATITSTWNPSTGDSYAKGQLSGELKRLAESLARAQQRAAMAERELEAQESESFERMVRRMRALVERAPALAVEATKSPFHRYVAQRMVEIAKADIDRRNAELRAKT